MYRAYRIRRSVIEKDQTNQTRNMSLDQQVHELRQKLASSELIREQQKQELENIRASKGELFLKIQALENEERTLKEKVLSQKQEFEELEEDLQVVEDGQLRLYVNYHALRAQKERGEYKNLDVSEKALLEEVKHLETALNKTAEEADKEHERMRNIQRKMRAELDDAGKARNEAVEQLHALQAQVEDQLSGRPKECSCASSVTGAQQGKLKEIEKLVGQMAIFVTDMNK